MKPVRHEWIEATFVIISSSKGEPGIVTKRNFYTEWVAKTWLEQQKSAADTLGLNCHANVAKKSIEVWVEGENNIQDAMRLAGLERALKS